MYWILCRRVGFLDKQQTVATLFLDDFDFMENEAIFLNNPKIWDSLTWIAIRSMVIWRQF